MASELHDLSCRSDLDPTRIQVAFLQADSLLRQWMTAANTQVGDQLLEVVAGPQTPPDWLGWTVRATLPAATGDPPGQLVSQCRSSAVNNGTWSHLCAGSEYTASASAPEHGSCAGGIGQAVAVHYLTTPLPVTAFVGQSLEAGQEHFVFALNLHTYSNRPLIPLMITRDVTTGMWMFTLESFQKLYTMGWSLDNGRLRSYGCYYDVFHETGVTLPNTLRRPLSWRIYSSDVAPVKLFQPLVAPRDFATYSRLNQHGMVLRASDGSEWLGIGSLRLMLRLKDPHP
jgi:hypothetical protein